MSKIFYLITMALTLGLMLAISPSEAQDTTGTGERKSKFSEVDMSFLEAWDKKKYSYHNGRHLKSEAGHKLYVVRVRCVSELESFLLHKEDVVLISKTDKKHRLRGGQSFQGAYRSELPEIVKGLCYIDLVFAIPEEEEESAIMIFDRTIELKK